MSGRQLNFSRAGENYEKSFDTIVSEGLLSVVRTPRSEDFGIDAYCQVLYPLDSRSVSVRGSLCVQIRGPSVALEYGGVEDGKHRDYEIWWLRTIASPFYLARVNKDRSRVHFYSLAPIAMTLGQSLVPFHIKCKFDEPTSVQFNLQRPVAVPAVGNSFGDGMVWTVNLGPPFLSVSQQELQDPVFAENARKTLEKWWKLDRVNFLRLALGVVNHEFVGAWHTNDFVSPSSEVQMRFMAWSNTNPGNVAELAGVLEPILTVLGEHLYSQQDDGAKSLMPILDWLASRGQLPEFGVSLRKRIKERFA